MGYGGIPMYFGPTTDGYGSSDAGSSAQGKPNDDQQPARHVRHAQPARATHFRGDAGADPHAPRFAARQQAAREWKHEFFNQQNRYFRRCTRAGAPWASARRSRAIPQRKPATAGQFGLLVSRYMKTKLRDVSGTAIMLLQAPIIGAVVGGGVRWAEEAIPYWCLGALQDLSSRSGGSDERQRRRLSSNMPTTADNSAAIFFLVVAAVWFGTSNAAREIVSERAIYVRERMVNLQARQLRDVEVRAAEPILRDSMHRTSGDRVLCARFLGRAMAFGIQLLTLIVTAMTSAATGAAVVDHGGVERSGHGIDTIALIPQVVLGGMIVPMTTVPWLKWPMMLMPARWGFQGVVAQERIAIATSSAWIIDLHKPDLNSGDNFVTNGKFQCALAQVASPDFNGAWGFVNYTNPWLPTGALAAMLFAQMLLILVLLKRRDSV